MIIQKLKNEVEDNEIGFELVKERLKIIFGLTAENVERGDADSTDDDKFAEQKQKIGHFVQNKNSEKIVFFLFRVL